MYVYRTYFLFPLQPFREGARSCDQQLACLLLVLFNHKPSSICNVRLMSDDMSSHLLASCCAAYACRLRTQWLNITGRLGVISSKLRCAMIRLINYSCQWGRKVLVPPVFLHDRQTPRLSATCYCPLCPPRVFSLPLDSTGPCCFRGQTGLTLILSSGAAQSWVFETGF